MFDLPELIQAVGLLGLFGIVFAETGLLIGFFLPGDSLLFTAGILSAQGYFDITLLIIILTAAAIIGDSVGYSIGRRLGPRVFTKEESLLFKKSHIEKAQAFFDKHGPKTIIIARFVPIVRTFAPTLAGVGKMEYKKFLSYNVIGAVIWVFSVTLLGYYLGKTVEHIDRYIIPGIIVIILISMFPYFKEFATNPEMRAQVWHYWNRIKNRIFPPKSDL